MALVDAHEPPAASGAVRRLVHGVVYALYLLVVVVAVAAGVHRLYLHRITPATPMKHALQPETVDPQTRARLGYLEAPRRNSFAQVPLAKPAGTVRIGCFGDSFTYGTEVLDGDEYAAVLGDLLHAAGHPEVEVLNFGNPGFGFHQTHMMWDLVGRRYDLDAAVVLAFPRLWTIRDVTFTFWNPPAVSLGFHARYVLDGDGLRLVDVAGADEPEWFEAYNRLLPPWRYLRFDRKPPSFVRGWIGAERTIANPFYYRRDSPTAESLESYRRLLARFADARGPVVVWDAEGALEPPPGSPPTFALRRTVPEESFLYRAPAGHFSRWGHRLLAEQTLRLFGVGNGAIPRITVRDLDAPPAPSAALRAPGDYRDAAVTLGGLPVARFFEFHRGKLFSARLASLPADVRGLLAVPLPGKSLVDALFLPLRDGASPPAVAIRDRAGLHPVPVTRLDDAGGALRLFRVELCSGAALAGTLPVPNGAGCVVPASFSVLGPAPDVALVVDGDEPLRIALTEPAGPEEPPTIELRPSDRYFRIRADLLARTEPEQLTGDGLVELVLQGSGGDVARLPLARWMREDLAAPPAWWTLPPRPPTGDGRRGS